MKMFYIFCFAAFVTFDNMVRLGFDNIPTVADNSICNCTLSNTNGL